MSHSRQTSRSMDLDQQGISGSWTRPKSWATESRPVSRHFPDELPSFFIPSYLKHSRYVHNLRQAYDERLARWKEHALLTMNENPSLSTSTSHVSLSKASVAHSHRPPALQDVVERMADTNAHDHWSPLPDRWSEDDRMNGLEILADGAEVRFAGVTKTSDEAASIRSDHPMPKECGIYYFEVTVLSRGKDGMIGVGFSAKKASLNRLPGWENDSFAYHGDDGNSFACTTGGKVYGPKFSSQDVIGCGLNFRTGNAFFTKNGVNLGTAFTCTKNERWYPSVGMKKPGEHLRANFGRTPFVFDIDKMMEDERKFALGEISRVDPTTLHEPDGEDTLIQKLVSQYLAHEGYVETAKAFSQDLFEQRRSLNQDITQLGLPSAEDDIHAINRQRIRKSILDGEIDRALKYTFTYYPRVLELDRNRDVYFRLRCRKFIEMMRRYAEPSAKKGNIPWSEPTTSSASNGRSLHRTSNDNLSLLADAQMELDEQLNRETSTGVELPAIDDDDMDFSIEFPPKLSSSKKESGLLNAAVVYGQELQHEFANDPRPHIKKQLQDLFAIIAYPNPTDSPTGQLFDPLGRIQIAEELNGAILSSLGKPSTAAIEKTCAQTELFLDEVSTKVGGAAAFVNMRHDFLQDS